MERRKIENAISERSPKQTSATLAKQWKITSTIRMLDGYSINKENRDWAREPSRRFHPLGKYRVKYANLIADGSFGPLGRVHERVEQSWEHSAAMKVATVRECACGFGTVPIVAWWRPSRIACARRVFANRHGYRLQLGDPLANFIGGSRSSSGCERNRERRGIGPSIHLCTGPSPRSTPRENSSLESWGSLCYCFLVACYAAARLKIDSAARAWGTRPGQGSRPFFFEGGAQGTLNRDAGYEPWEWRRDPDGRRVFPRRLDFGISSRSVRAGGGESRPLEGHGGGGCGPRGARWPAIRASGDPSDHQKCAAPPNAHRAAWNHRGLIHGRAWPSHAPSRAARRLHHGHGMCGFCFVDVAPPPHGAYPVDFFPAGSPRSLALQLLSLLARRPLRLVGLRRGDIARLPMSLHPTLLLDEPDSRPEMQTLLRSSSHRGTRMISSHGLLEFFGPKIVFSHKPPRGTALETDALKAALTPNTGHLPPLNRETEEEIADEFQARFLGHLLRYASVVRNANFDASQFTSPIQDLARTLNAAVIGEGELQKNPADTERSRRRNSRRSCASEWRGRARSVPCIHTPERLDEGADRQHRRESLRDSQRPRFGTLSLGRERGSRT